MTGLAARSARLALAAIAALVASICGARADEADPLEFTVRPFGLEGETLDQRLARRERAFRFICVGCVRGPGQVATEPFEPLRTLGAPGLDGALAAPPVDLPPLGD